MSERAAVERRASHPAVVSAPVIEAADLRKVYIGGDGGELVVLDGVEIAVAPAEAVAIVGASGAGKSTLLQLLGALDRPTAGDVRIGGESVNAMSENELARLRNRRIGFVFQFHHLLQEFTALENVMMPQLIAGVDAKEATERAHELLAVMDLSARLAHKPGQLSGGEQQRVAVARALANRPLVLLADEPSGNLDTVSSQRLHDLFFRVRDEFGVAMVLATHNPELAGRADRVLTMSEGRLQETTARVG